jgi:hypothetical protein
MIKKKKKLTCEDCGVSEGVDTTRCPYAYEIDDEEIIVDLCEDCYQQRAEDV